MTILCSAKRTAKCFWIKRVKKEAVESEEKEGTFDVTKHTFSEFYNWANEVDVADLQFIKEAIDINMEIAKKGMEKKYAFGVTYRAEFTGKGHAEG